MLTRFGGGRVILGALMVLAVLAPAPAAALWPCGRTGQVDRGCADPTVRADIEGTDVVLRGRAAIPGASSKSPWHDTDTQSGPPPSPGSAGPGDGGGNGAGNAGSGAGSGAGGGSGPGLPPGSQVVIRDGYTVTLAPPVRLSDLIRFRPVPALDRMEPAGWTVVGLDTNFFAMVAPQTQRGMLLGRPATVRFTPVRYQWDYGDRGTLTTAVKGSSWAASGLAEFSRTATSHSFLAAGEYPVDLRVGFVADYRFAGMGWTRITGMLTVPANRLRVVVVDAKTVLVGGDCSAGTAGPGC